MNRINHSSRFIEQFAKYGRSHKLGNVVELMDDKRRPINDAERQSMKTGKLYPYYGATGQVDMINSYLTDGTLLCIAEDCGNYKEGEESSYIITGKAWVNNHAHLVKPNDGCNITFLHYYLTICDLTPYVTGTTRQKLTQKSLVCIPVILPPIDEQRSFVSVVQQADKSKFNGFKSRFIEMYTNRKDFIRLGDLVVVRTGKLDANAADENGEYPFFTCGSETLQINKYAFDCEAVLLAGNGEFCVKYYDGKFNAYQRTYVIESADKGCLMVPFLFSWMRQYAATLKQKAIGGVIKYIRLGDITEAPFILPSVKEQEAYIRFINQADKSKYLN